MRASATELPGVRLIEVERIADERGWFAVVYQAEALAKALGESPVFAQDNHSCSAPGVLRGLHYQLPPSSQGKLVRVLRGAIYDVAVDLRRSSAHFGRWTARRLTADSGCQLWVPHGFAHGFLALEAGAEVLYKVDATYDSARARYLRWDDAALGIPWPLAGQRPILSVRDRDAVSLEQAECFD